MKKTKGKFWSAVYLGILVVVIVVFNSKLNSLQRELERVNNNLSGVDSRIAQINANIYNQDRVIDKLSKEFIEMDEKGEKINTRFTVELKKKSANSSIKLLLKNDISKELEEVNMVKVQGTTYSCEHPLSMKRNYSYTVIEESPDESVEKLTKYDRRLDIKKMIYDNRFKIESWRSNNSYGYRSKHYQIHFNNFSFGEFGEKFELEKAELEISLDDNILKVEDVTANVVQGGLGLIMEYQNALSAKTITQGTTVEEFKESIKEKYPEWEEFEDETFFYGYSKIIDGIGEAKDLGVDAVQLKNLKFTLIITCKDGFVVREE